MEERLRPRRERLDPAAPLVDEDSARLEFFSLGRAAQGLPLPLLEGDELVAALSIPLSVARPFGSKRGPER